MDSSYSLYNPFSYSSKLQTPSTIGFAAPFSTDFRNLCHNKETPRNNTFRNIKNPCNPTRWFSYY
ncbi:hypothetical protein AC579_5654 [Pseudocercospora musae]|uniref:Uncharacterized protein n=1 Tax=Pseudocercospora musae TaxID=113226 RepID=A0A139ICF7_9PEZI|nr:hypothetical protein AC579_5654 [Pseudocercospora musae]